MTLTISDTCQWLVANSWPRLDGEQRGDQIVFRGTDQRHWSLTAHTNAPGLQFLSLCPGGNLSSGHIVLTANAAGVVTAVDLAETYSGTAYASAFAPELLSVSDVPELIGALHQSMAAFEQSLEEDRTFGQEDLFNALLPVGDMAARFSCNYETEEA